MAETLLESSRTLMAAGGALVSTGLSLTAVIEVPRATVAVEYAVVPPLLETLTVLPLVREVEVSTRRVVSEPGVPLKLAAGRKRIEVVEAR
jgi:hypothetical protein